MTLLKEGSAQRVSITPKAREFRTQGARGFIDPRLAGEDNKQELYALEAVVIDRIIDRLFKTHTPEEIIDRAVPPQFDPRLLFLARDRIILLLFQTTDLEFKSIERILNQKDQSDPIISVVSRMVALTKIRDGDDEIQELIGLGIRTAAKTMAQVLDIIPSVHKREYPDASYDPDLLTTIARNSYPLIAQLAASHLREFVFVTNSLEQGSREGDLPFDPENFTIDSNRGYPHLVVSTKKRDEIEQEYVRLDPRLKRRATIGCPAMVNFGNGSAIKRLWEEVFVPIAEAAYHTKAAQL